MYYSKIFLEPENTGSVGDAYSFRELKLIPDFSSAL